MPSLNRRDSSVLIVDMQVKLLPAIQGYGLLLKRVEALIRGAGLLDVPVLATEHCADKIGATAPVLRPWIQSTMPKTHFDAAREPEFKGFLPPSRPYVLLVGAEAHVCVLQTALGLLDQGLQPLVVADGVGSRHAADYELALARCAYHRIQVVNVEMALFEWMESAHHPKFKDVLKLIKSGPSGVENVA
ncbi:MAG TPA: isochorismatase family protein [Paralcaligenes sp.]|jgi:nicotinamidase-related amidase